MFRVPFNRPSTGPAELEYIRQAIGGGRLAAGGSLSQQCERWLEREIGSERAFFVTSATAALDMQAALLDLMPGDEVIMPSFTFVSTALPFVARGVIPVFVDIRWDTLNIDETLIERAITERTRAIVVVHYAGVVCEMAAITRTAQEHGVPVLEDSAHALLSRYKNRPAGSFGATAALSFHESKNVHCGEGGAVLVNDATLMDRARVMADKGTNRAAFDAGLVNEYSWIDLGASYRASELNAAYLLGQLARAEEITRSRLEIWNAYHAAFEEAELLGVVRRPAIPSSCAHNGHIYHLRFVDREARTRFRRTLLQAGINAVRHYVPLHSSPGGLKFGRAEGELACTTKASSTLLRLPLWYGMNDSVCYVIDQSRKALTDLAA